MVFAKIFPLLLSINSLPILYSLKFNILKHFSYIPNKLGFCSTFVSPKGISGCLPSSSNCPYFYLEPSSSTFSEDFKTLTSHSSLSSTGFALVIPLSDVTKERLTSLFQAAEGTLLKLLLFVSDPNAPPYVSKENKTQYQQLFDMSRPYPFTMLVLPPSDYQKVIALARENFEKLVQEETPTRMIDLSLELEVDLKEETVASLMKNALPESTTLMAHFNISEEELIAASARFSTVPQPVVLLVRTGVRSLFLSGGVLAMTKKAPAIAAALQTMRNFYALAAQREQDLRGKLVGFVFVTEQFETNKTEQMLAQIEMSRSRCTESSSFNGLESCFISPELIISSDLAKLDIVGQLRRATVIELRDLSHFVENPESELDVGLCVKGETENQNFAAIAKEASGSKINLTRIYKRHKGKENGEGRSESWSQIIEGGVVLIGDEQEAGEGAYNGFELHDKEFLPGTEYVRKICEVSQLLTRFLANHLELSADSELEAVALDTGVIVDVLAFMRELFQKGSLSFDLGSIRVVSDSITSFVYTKFRELHSTVDPNTTCSRSSECPGRKSCVNKRCEFTYISFVRYQTSFKVDKEQEESKAGHVTEYYEVPISKMKVVMYSRESEEMGRVFVIVGVLAFMVAVFLAILVKSDEKKVKYKRT